VLKQRIFKTTNYNELTMFTNSTATTVAQHTTDESLQQVTWHVNKQHNNQQP